MGKGCTWAKNRIFYLQSCVESPVSCLESSTVSELEGNLWNIWFYVYYLQEFPSIIFSRGEHTISGEDSGSQKSWVLPSQHAEFQFRPVLIIYFFFTSVKFHSMLISISSFWYALWRLQNKSDSSFVGQTSIIGEF